MDTALWRCTYGIVSDRWGDASERPQGMKPHPHGKQSLSLTLPTCLCPVMVICAIKLLVVAPTMSAAKGILNFSLELGALDFFEPD